MSVCDAGYTTGSGVKSCRNYNRDVRYSKIYCSVDRKKLRDRESAPSGFTEVGIVKAPKDCKSFCFGDFIEKTDRLRKKYKRTYDSKNKLKCCLGDLDSETRCDPEWCWETDNCDTVVRNYCQTEEGQTDPRCGCLLPQAAYEETKLLGPPECVDVRCAGNPQAYRTKRQIDLNCPDIVNCSIGNITITGTDSNIDLSAIEQQCGSTFAEEVREMIAAGGTAPDNGPSPTKGNFLERTAERLGISSGLLIGGSAVVIILSVVLVLFLTRKN